MASAAQRRKKRIDRKAKAQRAGRVLPTEVMGLLSLPPEAEIPNTALMPSLAMNTTSLEKFQTHGTVAEQQPCPSSQEKGREKDQEKDTGFPLYKRNDGKQTDPRATKLADAPGSGRADVLVSGRADPREAGVVMLWQLGQLRHGQPSLLSRFRNSPVHLKLQTKYQSTGPSLRVNRICRHWLINLPRVCPHPHYLKRW